VLIILIPVPWRSRAALIGVVAPVALAGCSLGGDEEPQAVKGAPRQVAQTVGALERATRTGDYRSICDRLFTASARRRAGGRDCPRLLGSTAEGLRGPRIQILGIDISGDRAKVRVRSRAAGQPPLVDTIVLRRERGSYRIDALEG
jgi:hypothetical protein